VGHGNGFQERNVFFQNVYDKGLSPLSPPERDDQGLPGLVGPRDDGLAGLGVSMKDRPTRLRAGLSSFTTCTHDQYNHSRLYGQSLGLNLHGPNPRVMTDGEHRDDKEGEIFVLFWAWRWPCSFRYNR
jgi:hypothetical protein